MSAKIEPQLLRRLTVRRILELLQEHGPCTRADLTRQSQMSAPTISKAVDSLLESGLVEEGDARPSSIGRPAKIVRLATERVQVIGVAIDALRCTLVSAGLDGAFVADQAVQLPTPKSYSSMLATLEEQVRRLMRPDVVAVSIGLSLPGLIRGRAGISVFSPNLHLTDGKSPARDLQERLGISCELIQETHALSLAERMYHSSEALDDFVMMDISTGLGIGVFTGGRLLEGHSGLAGELGHITIEPNGRLCGCGNHGCLETLATDTALAVRVSERHGVPAEIDSITQLVREGRLKIDVELRQTCESLAIAIAAAVNLFNPAVLMVHGKLFDIQDGVFELTTELVRRRALGPSLSDCQIRRGRCSKLQGAVAAAVNALTNSMGPILD